MDAPKNMEELSKALEDWQRTLESEFDAIDAGDLEATMSLIKKKLAGYALSMADDLIGLTKAAETDATKLSAIKYAYEFIFGKEVGKGGSMESLLAELTKND